MSTDYTGEGLQRPPADTPALYAQDGKGYDATVFAHYFVGGCDWFVTEYDASEDVTFGWACLNNDLQSAELGYTSLAEMEAVRVMGIFRVEHDDYWSRVTLREALATRFGGEVNV